MPIRITELQPTRSAAKKYFINNKYTVCYTTHAVKQCKQRGLDCLDVILSLSGVPLRLWKFKGVVAKKSGTYVKIITCWQVKEVNIKPLW